MKVLPVGKRQSVVTCQWPVLVKMLGLGTLWNWISLWYFKYSINTEIYMIEKWENYTIHGIFAFIFLLQWYFNRYVLLSFVNYLFTNAQSGQSTLT